MLEYSEYQVSLSLFLKQMDISKLTFILNLARTILKQF